MNQVEIGWILTTRTQAGARLAIMAKAARGTSRQLKGLDLTTHWIFWRFRGLARAVKLRTPETERSAKNVNTAGPLVGQSL